MPRLFQASTILKSSLQKSYKKWIYLVKFGQLYPEPITSPKNYRVLKVVVLDKPDDKLILKLINNNEIDKHLTTMTNTNLTTHNLGSFIPLEI